MDIHQIKHDLKRDVHNLINLLKFIKEDEVIKDPDLKTMLEIALQKENAIHKQLNDINEFVNGRLRGV
jgi:hypothetical protein